MRIEQLQLLSRRQTASLLNVTVRTLQRLEKRGQLEPIRVGKVVRYRVSNVERIVNP
jgi:excisionase family DNA binding protein